MAAVSPGGWTMEPQEVTLTQVLDEVLHVQA